jgi:hypothetical protein
VELLGIPLLLIQEVLVAEVQEMVEEPVVQIKEVFLQ